MELDTRYNNIIGETGASSAWGIFAMWLYLACKLRYGAGKHIWKLLYTSTQWLHC